MDRRGPGAVRSRLDDLRRRPDILREPDIVSPETFCETEVFDVAYEKMDSFGK
jgi:hypothetical protein